MNTRSSTPVAGLRQQAEAAAVPPEQLTAQTPEEIQRMLHELQVHQIELELQNEELRRIQAELEDSRARYFDLYDLAPVGYCTLAATGLIREANLTAASLLDRTRPTLVGRPFSQFILKEDQDAFFLAFKKLFGTGSLQTGELRMAKQDGTSFWAHLRMLLVPDSAGEPTCRVVLSDITDLKQRDRIQSFLAQASGGNPGEPFFPALARFLAESLAMDFICIDRLEGDGLTARTEAVWCDGRFEDNVSYALKDTPCGEVVGKHICCFPSQVCQFFPDDLVLQELRAESYAGTTLFDHAGKPNGLIVAISRKPLANRPLVEAALQLVALRAAGELERVQAEEAQRASEREWRLLAEAMPQIVWVCQPDGRVIYFNQQWVDYTGLTLAETSGHDWTKPFHPDDRQRAWDAWQNAVHNGGTYALECRLRRVDGRYHWWLIRGVAGRDADGEILKWFGTYTDIEDLKQGEAALRESAEMLSEAQRIAGLGSYALDIASGKWSSSAVLDEVYGIDAAYERTVAGWAALIHPEDRAMMMDHYSREVIGDHGFFNKEYRIIRQADQAERWVHGLGHLELDDQGHPQRMHGTVQDITERRRAEAALREKMAELRASNAELERFNRAMVDRELRMVELKAEINALCQRLGEPPLHALDVSDVSDAHSPPASA